MRSSLILHEVTTGDKTLVDSICSPILIQSSLVETLNAKVHIFIIAQLRINLSAGPVSQRYQCCNIVISLDVSLAWKSYQHPKDILSSAPVQLR
jgi:hypothetical protein